MSYSSANTIKTIARREVEVLMRSKGMVITLALTLIITVGGIFLINFLQEKDESANESANGSETIAVVDFPAEALAETGYETAGAADREAAEAEVTEGNAVAALVPAKQGWEVLFDGSPEMSIMSTLEGVITAQASAEGLAEFGISPQELAAATPDSTVSPVDISSGEDEAGAEDRIASVGIVLASTMILFMSIMMFAANIGSRVSVEKSSRVVEILLSTVRPMDLLTGKLLGNAVFGLACTALIIGAGAGSLLATGLLDGIAFNWSILPLLLIGFILGILFFGSLYAAAGSLVQRLEDLQSTQAPILILLMATLYVPLFGWTNLDATWMQVVAWIPPLSLTVAPLQYATGNFDVLQLLGAYGILAIATIAALWIVARIFRASILNNGKKMTWRESLTR